MPQPLFDIPMRIVLEAPPRGVVFALQRGKRDLAVLALSTGEDLRFDFVIGCRLAPDAPDFAGPFAQGPRGGRFVYLNAGALAGQADSLIRRRAKIQLGGVSADQIAALQADSSQVLCARIAGTARDGGPPAATVPIMGGWQIVSTRA